MLLSDQPVGEDGQQDLLSRSIAARQLADLIRASRAAAPFALAVYADWGMGKSSMLSQVEAQFRAAPDVKTVWFNAWTANRGDALETLIKSVLGQLDPSALRRLARRFSGESGLGTWARILLRGAAGAVRLHHLVDEIWTQLSVDARLRNEARDQLSKVLREWTKGDGRAPDGRMIVVFVDDLDRCPADVIGVVCDAVKQYLSVPGLVFVLGCDQTVIESSVMIAAAGQQTTATIGRRYLEKIVQASYTIPVPTDEDAAKLVEGYARQSGTQALFQGAVAEAVTRHASRNPRRIKRLINRFVIEYRLDPQWQLFGADALIRVILLQDLYPEFYALLARTEDLDPIDEFAEYHWLCSLTGARPDENGRRRVEAILTEHEIAWPALAESEFAVTEDLVARVERELPPVYLSLARDKTFVGLAAELAESAENEAFRARLRRRRAIGAIAGVSLDIDEPETVSAYARETDPYDYPPPSRLDLSELSILWICDKPDEWQATGGFVERYGARVAWAENGTQALHMLSGMPAPSALITNLSREYGREGGFEDLARVGAESGYTGPLIVYTSFVSSSREERAKELGARITDRQSVVLGWLEELTRSAAGNALRVLVLRDDDPPDAVERLASQPNVRSVTALGSAFSVLRRNAADAVVVAHRQYAPGMIEHIAETLRFVFTGPIAVYSDTEFSDEEALEARGHGAQILAGEIDLINWLSTSGRRHAMSPQRSMYRDGPGADADTAAAQQARRLLTAEEAARFQRRLECLESTVTRSDGRSGNPPEPGAD